MTNPSASDEALRRRAVAAAIALTVNTPLAPKRYERQLLARYQAGELTIDQVLELLEASVYHVFYHSRARPGLVQADLDALLDWSRRYNAAHGLTGLLLYSDERFVQVLEGTETAVRTLFTRIQQDERHTQVVTLSEGPGPKRWFAEWSMTLGEVNARELEHVLDIVETKTAGPVAPLDPHLAILLQAFGLADPDLG
ncbi:BLUF domain-containing protein [Hymenobacter volaticus]|uniref:BLUF domain-containing protein n=1 Tax=Hymenobacter volaticus TaxID=2932254 RepID=A0ABY4GFV2_9BACT|nr:BLUF domain-containing protein [Hymenobacter volaticus]UOQ69364.1 BLUF domain-containing protein [Hymenobacter volaticus]